MTGDEMERAIEIILHNQANFEVQFEKTSQQLQQTDRQMEATNARLEALAKRVETVAEQVEIVAEQVGTVVEQVRAVGEQVGTVAETQTEFIQITIRHIEAQGEINVSLRGMIRELKESQLRLAESQTRTDARLDRLADTVERYIREGRNGNS